MYDERFTRSAALLGDAAMERLSRSAVAVFGLGGVGSWCAEALARSGVGALILIDEDTVNLSNCNRQAEATDPNLGRPKAEALAERIHSFAPGCRLTPLTARYEPEQREAFFRYSWDYAADAIDIVTCKLDLIESCRRAGRPLISALGTGNKKDASRLRLCDIAETSGCPFARIIRKELRRRGIEHHPVVYSPEPASPAEQREAPPPGRRSVPGSLMWVPASAGLLMAQHIVLSLAGETE